MNVPICVNSYVLQIKKKNLVCNILLCHDASCTEMGKNKDKTIKNGKLRWAQLMHFLNLIYQKLTFFQTKSQRQNIGTINNTITNHADDSNPGYNGLNNYSPMKSHI